MRAAIATPGRFPVPRYKQGVDKPHGNSEIQEIARLDDLMTEPNKPDKVPEVDKLMQPCAAASYESGGAQCYIYGPFFNKEELIATLRNDPMLQPVHNKWSKFDASVLDAATRRGTLYLQIRWQGWFVRPVLEMTKEQLASLLEKARADANKVMLTYGGGGGGIGKSGSFDSDKEWFGFKKDYLSANKFANSDAVFADMQVESSKMRAAIATPKQFPVPQYKQQGIEKPPHSEQQEIARLDGLMSEPNKPDKVPEIEKTMQPFPAAASYES